MEGTKLDEPVDRADSVDLVPGWWSPLLTRTEWLIFEAPFWTWFAVLGALLVVKDGVAGAPENPAWLSIARAFPNQAALGADRRYQYSSPLLPALAHVLGIGSVTGYEALGLLVALVACTVLAVGLYRRGGRLALGVGTVALFASPLSNLLFTQLGKQDGLTFGALSAAVLFDSPAVALGAGVILGLSHPEVAVVSIAVLAALAVVDRRREQTPRLIGLVGGFLLGLTGNAVYAVHIANPLWSRESTAAGYSRPMVLREYVEEFPTLLFSVFNAWWLFLALTFRRLGSRRCRQVLITVAAVAGLMTMMTLDETRVWALLLWVPVLVTVLLALRALPAPALRRVTAATFLAAVVLPRVIVQGGATSVSSLGVIIRWLFRA